MREEILVDCVKEFPCIYDKNQKSDKDRTVLGNTWQKVIEKLENSNFDMEVQDAKAVFANLKKRYQNKRATFRRAKESGQGSKEVLSLKRIPNIMRFFDGLMISRVKENQKQMLVLPIYSVIPIKNEFSGIEDKEEPPLETKKRQMKAPKDKADIDINRHAEDIKSRNKQID